MILNAIVHLAKYILCLFCHKHGTNQKLLFPYMDKFLTNEIDDAEICMAILDGNTELCMMTDRSMMRKLCILLQSSSPRLHWLRVLSTVFKPNAEILRPIQEMLSTELSSMFDDTLFLMNSSSRVRTILDSFLSTTMTTISRPTTFSTLKLSDNTFKQDLEFNVEFLSLLNRLITKECDTLLKKYQKWFKLTELIEIIIHPIVKCYVNFYPLRHVYMESLTVICASREFRKYFAYQYSESLCVLWQSICAELDELLIYNKTPNNEYKIFLRDSLIESISKIFLQIQLLADHQPQYHQETSRRLMHKLIKLNNDPLLGRVADECSQIIMCTIASTSLPNSPEFSYKMVPYLTRSHTQLNRAVQREQSSECESVFEEPLNDENNDGDDNDDGDVCANALKKDPSEMLLFQRDTSQKYTAKKSASHLEDNKIRSIDDQPKSQIFANYIEKQFNYMIKEMEHHLTSSIHEEYDSLVKFLQYPLNSIELQTIRSDSFSYNAFIASLMQHAYDLIKIGSEDQFVKLLQIFTSLSKTSVEKHPSSEGKWHSNTMTLNHNSDRDTTHYFLCSNGICDLIIKCIENPNTSEAVFIMANELAINLLKYGNKHVQECFYSILSKPKIHEDFFNAIFQSIHNAYSQVDSLPKNKSFMKEGDMSPTNYSGYSSQLPSGKFVTTLKTLTFLQTLCNRSNIRLQELLRIQPHNVTTFNLIEEIKSLFLNLWKTNDNFIVSAMNTSTASTNHNNNQINDNNGHCHDASNKTAHEGQLKVNGITKVSRLQNLAEKRRMKRLSINTGISLSNQNQQSPKVHTDSYNNCDSTVYSSSYTEMILLILTCLIQFCQGPCINNQYDIAFGSPNILNELVNLISDTPVWMINDKFNEIRFQLAKISLSSIKLLLAVLEGRNGDNVFQRLLDLWPIDKLINAIRNYHILSQNPNISSTDAEEVLRQCGHSLFILTQYLHRNFPVILKHMKISDTTIPTSPIVYNDLPKTKWSELTCKNPFEEPVDDNNNMTSSSNDLRKLKLDSTIIKRLIKNQSDSLPSLQHYAMNTAQIEIIRENNKIERIIYPIPEMCQYLTNTKKCQLLNKTIMDDDHTKLPSLFELIEDIYAEMLCAKHMLVHPWIHWFSFRSQWISDASFYQTLCLNFLLITFYPFQGKASLSYSLNEFETEMAIIPFALFAVLLCLICSNQLSVQIYVGLETLYLLDVCGSENIIHVLGLTNLIFRLANLIIIYRQHSLITQYKKHLFISEMKAIGETGDTIKHSPSSSSSSSPSSSLFKIDNVKKLFSPHSIKKFFTSTWRKCKCLSIRKLLKCFPTLFTYLKHQNMNELNHKLIHNLLLITFAALGVFLHPLFHSLVLLDVITREETLLNVVRSVTKNGRSIFLTGILALIIIYLYSIVGHVYFRNDFAIEVDDHKETTTHEEETGGKMERRCDTLKMCMLTTLREGLLNGGGIGEALRRPSSEDSSFIFRTIYDLSFFVIVIVIILNLIFGVIVDTFAALRQEKQNSEELNKNHCCVCGLHRSAFDHSNTSFDEHVEIDHNVWHYVYFIIYLKTKPIHELTSQEIYINKMVKKGEFKWIPRRRAMALHNMETVSTKKAEEIDQLAKKLEKTIQAVESLNEGFKNLSKEIAKQNMEKSKEKLISHISNSISNQIKQEKQDE
ncbi:unnamed protein product [Trichobilharzia szidati]|nr:unnamed protein product [Trichobilharzia szidati]